MRVSRHKQASSGYFTPSMYPNRHRQCQIHQRLLTAQAEGVNQAATSLQLNWPPVCEEYFELATLLSSVVEYVQTATTPRHVIRPYTMVELGSGYGFWAFTALGALRQQLPPGISTDDAVRLLLVDITPTLSGIIEETGRLNNLRFAGRWRADGQLTTPEASLHFHCGLIGPTSDIHDPRRNTSTLNTSALNEALNASTQDGISTVPASASHWEKMWGVTLNATHDVQLRPPMTFEDLLSAHQMPKCIDLVDIDIQGFEYPTYASRRGKIIVERGLFYGTEVIELLTRRARRVHIGVHGDLNADATLISVFEKYGWELRRHYAQQAIPSLAPGWKTQRTSTPLGMVQFADGLLDFVNHRARECW